MNNKMVLNDIIKSELKKGTSLNNPLTARFDKEVLNGIKRKLNKKIALDLVEFATLADMLSINYKFIMEAYGHMLDIDSEASLATQIKYLDEHNDKKEPVEVKGLMLLSIHVDDFIQNVFNIEISSGGLSVPELESRFSNLKIRVYRTN